MNIDSAVLDVLSNSATIGNALKLQGKLDRKLYVSTNKVLELAGGKWNRKTQTHLFNSNAAEIMDQIILTGKITNTRDELGFFPTPPDVVTRMMKVAAIDTYHRVLEPSAGTGNILRAIGNGPDKVAMEINPEFMKPLANCGVSRLHVYEGDFLHETPDGLGMFDRVVMNPPFAKQADIRHVNHALTFLKSGGRLVSIMSAGVTFRTNSFTTVFRETVASHSGWIEPLPEDAFKSSKTNVNTVMVVIPN